MNYRVLTFLGFLIILLSSCNSDPQEQDQLLDSDVVTNPNSASGKGNQELLPVITFEETEHNFGRIIEGETVSFNFAFKNTGKRDLVIAEVSTSCGCTVPSYPKRAIRPGESGVINIAFNSKGRKGYQTKTIIVCANTQPNVTQLKIKAQVIAPGAE
ncbi:MAG: DUF1573 domain-containing protein [Bacteroidales bacterium]|nr:DUF1573 domain-containing protein [Bacteroidales bacterium]